MRSLTTFTALAAAVGVAAFSSTAEAGGVGVFATPGVRQMPAYFYNSAGDQGIDWQLPGSYGFGVEGILGDKDDRIMGIARFYYLSDLPVSDPDTGNAEVTPEDGALDGYVYPPAADQPASAAGAAAVGIQWGIFGDPTGLQFVLSTVAGTAFITTDNLEFFMFEPGAGVTYTVNDQFQFYGVANYQLRFRKRFTSGANVVAGARFLFD